MPQANRLKLPSASIKDQMASKLTWNEVRSADRADFFTIGYAGRKTEDLIATLKEHGVKTLLDIRRNPISMYRPDLSKNNFAKLLAREHISYVHVPELGVPREIRAKAVDSGSRDVIWSWYDANVVASCLNSHYFMSAYQNPVALMCTEMDPCECHRHRLSLALEALGLTSFDL